MTPALEDLERKFLSGVTVGAAKTPGHPEYGWTPSVMCQLEPSSGGHYWLLQPWWVVGLQPGPKRWLAAWLHNNKEGHQVVIPLIPTRYHFLPIVTAGDQMEGVRGGIWRPLPLAAGSMFWGLGKP